eukprot:3078729-Pyramimonas_sp.AAC.1
MKSTSSAALSSPAPTTVMRGVRRSRAAEYEALSTVVRREMGTPSARMTRACSGSRRSPAAVTTPKASAVVAPT